MAAADISPQALADEGLPQSYDLVVMTGNVPAFLPEVSDAFTRIEKMLSPDGTLIVGTTAHTTGGPADQDAACNATSLRLENRFGDWHLGHFHHDSPWSVSVFSRPEPRSTHEAPDGMYILPADSTRGH